MRETRLSSSMFDEREEETEPRQTGLRRPGENLTNCHREANVTAPFSTPLKIFLAKVLSADGSVLTDFDEVGSEG